LRRYHVFPFTAIVGQERAKLALIVNAINPLIGGVLLRGDRGTGKSTMVRAFAEVLPEIEVVAGCPFNCNPNDPAEMCDIHYEMWLKGDKLPVEKRKMRVVELPLNATVDRVVGTLDVQRALKEGIKALEPGILAEANRNILYIDEVNLLDDYLVDVLLDAAASGWNIVEREGISVRHPARFILVGSMNPEEGELRPQILDRFGLVVDMEVIDDPELRCEIVERVEAFYSDPEGFLAKYEKRERRLRERIKIAREILKDVKVDRELIMTVAKLMSELKVRTHRAEITCIRTAKAIAAFNGRHSVNEDDIKAALELVLPHRLKASVFDVENVTSRNVREILESLGFERGNIKRSFDKFRNLDGWQVPSFRMFQRGMRDLGRPQGIYGHQALQNTRSNIYDLGYTARLPSAPFRERVFGVDKRVKVDGIPRNFKSHYGAGIRAARRIYAKEVGGLSGAYIGYVVPKDPKNVKDIAIDASIRAATLRQLREGISLPLKIKDEDIRERVRRKPVPHLTVFMLDSSGSMAALRRIELAKGILWNLAQRAYINKDFVSLIVFRQYSAKVVVEPTRNYGRVLKAIEKTPTGGKTPLSHALLEAYRLIAREKAKHKNLMVSLVIVTDCKANVPLKPNSSIAEEVALIGEKLRKLGVYAVLFDTRFPYERNIAVDIMRALVSSLNASVVRVPLTPW